MGRAFLVSQAGCAGKMQSIGAGILEKGDGCVRGVGDSAEGQVGWAVLRRWTKFLSWGVKGLDSCYVGQIGG